MTGAANGKTRYYPALTGIRAIAAYMVFIYHFNPVIPVANKEVLYYILNNFNAGVSIFFVLSGFLIFNRYSDSMSFSKRFLRSYLLRRFARIYPLYFVLTTLDELVLRSGVFFYLMNITLLKGVFNDLKFSGIPQGWSLTVEECFYILAVPMILLRKKLPIVVQPILFITIGVILVLACRHFHPYGLFETFRFMFNYTFFGRCTEFCIGAMLAHHLKIHGFLFRNFPTYTLAGCAGIFVCIYLISLSTRSSDHYLPDTIYQSGIFINNLILPFTIAAFFYGLITERSGLQSLLSSRLFNLLGKSSYAFYLIHMGVIELFLQNIFHNYAITFLVLNVLSILFYKFVEQPLNNLIIGGAKKKPIGLCEDKDIYSAG